MQTCIFPGSFDPITKGHVDIIERAARIFSRVIVAILCNSEKTPCFDLVTRRRMIETATAHIPGVVVQDFEGLLVDFLRQSDCRVVLRGVRGAQDLPYEQQIGAVNQHLMPEMETVVLMSKPEYSIISSTLIRELIGYKADLSLYVPQPVIDMIYVGE